MLIRTIDLPPEEKTTDPNEAMARINKESDELVNKALEDIGYSKDFVYRNYQNFRSILQDISYSKDYNCELDTIIIEYKGEEVLLFRRIIDFNEWKLSYYWETALPKDVIIL